MTRRLFKVRAIVPPVTRLAVSEQVTLLLGAGGVLLAVEILGEWT